MRPSVRVLAARRLQYHLGLSYAAKQSPPFVPASATPASPGFASLTLDPVADDEGNQLPPKPKTKLARWVEGMKLLPAGRGELRASKEEDGGWDKDLRERVWKWGAGEDFFAVETGGGAYVSTLAVSACDVVVWRLRMVNGKRVDVHT